MTKPVEDFISREIDPELTFRLKKLSAGLDELVNFGSHIIAWDLNRENGSSFEDLPPMLFLRNFLEEIYGISILIRASSSDSSKNLLRTAIENIFYLEYILREDSKNRALSYLIWEKIKTNKALSQTFPNSDEHKAMLIRYKKDKFLKNSVPHTIKNAKDIIEIGEKIFDHPEFQPIKKEYDATKARIKNPAWFALFNGPKNIEDLARKLELDALYDVMYRGLSDSIHGTDIIDGKIAQLENQVGINQIRSPLEAQSITFQCLSLSVVLFKSYIEARLPNKISEYDDWQKRIRGFFFHLKRETNIVDGYA